jgi:hypothetical protein
MTLGRVLWIGWCTLWAVFWITLGWLFLPGINVFLFILSLVLMIPAMINTAASPTRGPVLPLPGPLACRGVRGTPPAGLPQARGTVTFGPHPRGGRARCKRPGRWR